MGGIVTRGRFTHGTISLRVTIVDVVGQLFDSIYGVVWGGATGGGMTSGRHNAGDESSRVTGRDNHNRKGEIIKRQGPKRLLQKCPKYLYSS